MGAQAVARYLALFALTAMLLSGFDVMLDARMVADEKNAEGTYANANYSRMGTPSAYANAERTFGHGSDIGLYDSLVVKNIDDDPHMELVFGNAQGFVHVLDYDGNNTTDQWTSQKNDKNTHAVAVDDIDSDGRMDILFTTNTGVLHDYEWNGSSFAWQWSSPELGTGTTVNPFKTVVADTNGDGIKEIILGIKDGRIKAFNGSNPSSAVNEPNVWEITKGQMPYGIIVGDCEYDGKNEIVVGFEAGDVYIFNGSDKGVRAFSDRLGGEAFGLAMGDIDRDGFKELAVSGDKCIYFFNLSDIDANDSGNWTVGDAKFKTGDVQSNMYAVKLDDPDNDGALELICGGGTASGGKVYFFEWNGTALEQAGDPVVIDCEVNSIVVKDVDGDLSNETVFADSNGFVYVLSNTTDGFELDWALNSVYPEPFGMLYSDIDGDAVEDLVVGTGTGYLTVFDDTVATLGFEQLTYFSEDYGTDLFGMRGGDVDRDGRKELIVGTASKKVIVVEPDPLSGGFMTEWDMTLIATSFWGLDVGDVDGEGVQEIVAGDSDGYIYIWRYASGAGEGVPPDYVRVWRSEDMGDDMNFIRVEDVDNDARCEIIAGNADGKVHIVEYIASNSSYMVTWTSQKLGTSTAAAASCVDISDYDKDGTKEIVVGENHGYIYVFDPVTHEQEFSVRIGTSKMNAVRVFDVDNDTVNEFVVAANNGLVYSFALRNGYRLEWQSDMLAESTGAYGAMHVSYIDDDGKVEAIIGASGYIYVLNFSIYKNNPPIIGSAVPNSHTCIVNEPNTQQFSIAASDADNDVLTYKWFRNGTQVSGAGSNAYSLVTNYSSAGYFVLRVEVWDNDTCASWNWTVTIVDVNPPPVIDYFSPAGDKNIDEGNTVLYEVTASDPNDVTLYYTWYLDGVVVLSGPSERAYTYNAEKYRSEGMHTIRVHVTDNDPANYVEHSWSIIVNRLAGVELDCPSGQNVSAGKTTIYTFTLRNTGTGKDSFRITASSSNNWSIQLSVNNTPEMNSNESRSILVSLRVPSNLKADTTDIIRVTATSNYRSMIAKSVQVATNGHAKPKPISDDSMTRLILVLAIIFMVVAIFLLLIWARGRSKVSTPARCEVMQPTGEGGPMPDGQAGSPMHQQAQVHQQDPQTQGKGKLPPGYVPGQYNNTLPQDAQPQVQPQQATPPPQSHESSAERPKGKLPPGYVPGPYKTGQTGQAGQVPLQQAPPAPPSK